jgi:hypothetical protein
MKKITFCLLFAATFMLTSCIDIVEELTLNKQGKGKYNMKIDLSGIMQLGSLKDLMNQAGADADATSKMGDKMEKDTMIFLKDAPLELRQKTGDADFWKKAKVHMKMSESKKEFFVDMQLDFDKIEDVAFFYKNVGEVMKESGKELGDMLPTDILGGGSAGGPSVAFKTSGKTFTRLANTNKDAAPKDEDLSMIKMFLGGAKYKVVYNLPGKVKKTKMDKAQVNGNTVTIEHDLLEMLEGKAKLAGDISFK